MAERWRTGVGLNLPDLEAVLAALIQADVREPRSLVRRIERARNRRLRAVERAQGR
jgi:hypothetical protein